MGTFSLISPLRISSARTSESDQSPASLMPMRPKMADRATYPELNNNNKLLRVTKKVKITTTSSLI